MPAQQDASRLVQSACAGDPSAVEALLPLVYDELRLLAGAFLARERPDHTLQATALVHEAYLRLVDQSQVEWQGRAHFCAIAATVMRRILVDHARGKERIKRRTGGPEVSLDTVLLVTGKPDEDLVALDEALSRLGTFDPRKARVVELRFFGGLSINETAEVLGVSARTVDSEWAFSRAWLHDEITRGSSP